MSANQFSIANIPYGIASSKKHPSRSVVTRLQDAVIFLDEVAKAGLLEGLEAETLEALTKSTINSLAAVPRSQQILLRQKLQAALPQVPASYTSPVEEVTLHLPVAVGGFTDFSCSKEHNLNASLAIRGIASLPPSFIHNPIGYSGRSSSIVISGTPIIRPKGLYRDDNKEVVFGPEPKMDYELEVACIIGKATNLGQSVPIESADEHIFGVVLINDWSARAIQSLEMPPLGPMNGKSFGTSMSPWIVTLDALEPFMMKSPERAPGAASYLKDPAPLNTYSIQLEATLTADGGVTTLCKSRLESMYWSLRDLVVQQTVNGCSINVGDVLATGTISGTTPDSHGCLMEMTRGGAKSYDLIDGQSRTYLNDGDLITLTAIAGDGVGFGECSGQVVPALP